MPPPKDETAEQREARLVKARKKASNVREEKMIEKYKNKVLEKVKKEEEDEDDESDKDDKDDKDEEAPDKLLKPVKEPKPMPVKEIISKEPKEPKAPKKKQSKVIIEQSSDDEDVFEDKPNVIFVKRVRPKPLPLGKVEPNTPCGGVPAQQQQQQPNQQFQQQHQQQRPPQPQRPALTPEKRLEMQRYINMSQGNFLPVCRPR